MKTLEERLANARAELERQTAEWERAMSALAALGGAQVLVPVEALAKLDAVVKHAHTATGGVPV